MNFFKSHGLATVIALSISACSTMPQQGTTPDQHAQAKDTPAKPFTEKPGEISFGNSSADVMYEILIGELATQRGNASIASDFYLDAARQSKNPEIAARAVRISNFAKNKENALKAAEVWVEAEPDNLEALRIISVLYLRENEVDKAQEYLSKLLKSDNESVGRNILLTGAMLQRETSAENAEKIARHLITLFPEQGEAYYIHASLAIQADLNEVALESIKKCLALKPEWEDAIILYARILEENAQGDKAVAYLKNYLKTNPKSNAVRLAYARSLTNARKLEEARGQFELLAIKMPDNQDVL
ncbi:MAG: hypothetical protein R3240_04685, partial [Gammaproteobacteria bacterium]|nr:hypothetical protein [Gammaproteobacteria bacterium]